MLSILYFHIIDALYITSVFSNPRLMLRANLPNPQNLHKIQQTLGTQNLAYR